MSLEAVINEYHKHITYNRIAKLLDVTPHQVYLYANGTTKNPKDSVVDKIYELFRIDGEPVVLDLFGSEEEYLRHRKIRESLGG